MSYWSEKNRNDFHINGYRFQYWLYAVLNKMYGKEVHFHRDSLHRIYQVNRHGFEVSSNTMSIQEVKNGFVKKLKEAGFTVDEKAYQSKDCIDLCKKNFYEKGDESLHISIRYQATGLDHKNSNKPVLIVSVGSYYHKKQEKRYKW